jgi:hypothetical protein
MNAFSLAGRSGESNGDAGPGEAFARRFLSPPAEVVTEHGFPNFHPGRRPRRPSNQVDSVQAAAM